MSFQYLADLKASLLDAGVDTFLRLNPHPVLIVLGLAGKLKGAPSLEKTIISETTDTLILTQLVGRVFPVVKAKFSPPGPVTIGRNSDSDIAIADSSISKRHCFVATVGAELRLTDCGSTNGTFINGERVIAKKPVALHGGENVTLGRIAFLLHRPHGFRAYLTALP